MHCFLLSFQHKQCHNGYMGLCKAAFILFALCFPIKSHSLRIYGTLQGSTYTMQVNPLQKQYFFFAFQQKHHHNRNLDFARQHIFLYIFFRLQVLSSLSTTSNLSVVNSRFISVKMRLTNKIVEKWSIFIEENFRCGRIKKKAGNENQYRI